jgi:hypothetical protein
MTKIPQTRDSSPLDQITNKNATKDIDPQKQKATIHQSLASSTPYITHKVRLSSGLRSRRLARVERLAARKRIATGLSISAALRRVQEVYAPVAGRGRGGVDIIVRQVLVALEGDAAEGRSQVAVAAGWHGVKGAGPAGRRIYRDGRAAWHGCLGDVPTAVVGSVGVWGEADLEVDGSGVVE